MLAGIFHSIIAAWFIGGFGRNASNLARRNTSYLAAEGHFIAAAKNGELINSADGKNWKAGAPATDLVSVR